MKSLASGADLYLEKALKTKIQQATRSLAPQAQWRLFSMTLIVVDALMIGLAFRLAYFFRFELNLSFFRLDVTPLPAFYQNLVFFLVPIWLVIFAVLGLYNRHNLLGGTHEYALLFRAPTIGLLLVIVAGFLEQTTLIVARGWLVLAWLFTFLGTLVGRFAVRHAVYFLRQHGYFLTPALIVGANQEGRSLAEQLLSWKTSGLHVLGFVDDTMPIGMACFRNLQNLGTIEQLDKIVSHYGVEELILATSAIGSREKMLAIFKRYGIANGVNVRLSSGLYEIITTGLTVKEFAYVPLVGVNRVRLTGIDSFFKLLLDYAITLPGLLMISPVLVLIVLAIKFDSPGPIVHRRRVMGVNGRQFDAFKFRTMYMNGDEILAAHPELQAELALHHKLKDDPRITRVGRFLRKYSLDELPQLLNVLKRDMSLVGPRMISPAEMNKYNQWDLNLLTVKPGITGLWQVSGRSDVSYEERVRLDMYYIRNWTIWLDLQLLLETFPAVMNGRGAY
jgi:exopolysaccharide biosynthesis polyprenyl glycosylphosphotransferase